MPKLIYLEDTHILTSEYACPHCGKLPPRFRNSDGDIDLPYLALFRAYEQIRAARGGQALAIENGYRCLDYNRALYEAWVAGGKKGAAHAFCSTHMFGVALDLTPVSVVDQKGIVMLAKRVTPLLRIGWKQYMKAGVLLVHIDYGQFIEPAYSSDLVAGAEW